jgi:hypothetical protein
VQNGRLRPPVFTSGAGGFTFKQPLSANIQRWPRARFPRCRRLIQFPNSKPDAPSTRSTIVFVRSSPPYGRSLRRPSTGRSTRSSTAFWNCRSGSAWRRIVNRSPSSSSRTSKRCWAAISIDATPNRADARWSGRLRSASTHVFAVRPGTPSCAGRSMRSHARIASRPADSLSGPKSCRRSSPSTWRTP